MDVRSIIEREGGTKADIDGTNYHFKPRTPNGPHLATVSDKRHLKRFLSIPEGFEPYVDGDDEATAPETSVAAIAAGTDEPIEPPHPTANAPVEQVQEPVASPEPQDTTPVEPTQTAPVTAEPVAPTTAEPVDPVSNETAADEQVEPQIIDPQEALATIRAAESAGDVSRGDLEAAFEFLNGRKPNAQAKDETIFDRIKAKLEENTDAAD